MIRTQSFLAAHLNPSEPSQSQLSAWPHISTAAKPDVVDAGICKLNTASLLRALSQVGTSCGAALRASQLSEGQA